MKYCIDCGKKVSNPKSLRCRSCSKKTNNNPMWKEDNVGCSPLHNWVRRYKPKPKLCEICKKNKPYDLANISGKYKRNINDFEWLCRKCHMTKDGRLKKLHKLRKDVA